MLKHSTFSILCMMMLLTAGVVFALTHEVSLLSELSVIADYLEKVSESPKFVFYSFWASPIALGLLLSGTSALLNKIYSQNPQKCESAKRICHVFIWLLVSIPAVWLGILSIRWELPIVRIGACVVVPGVIMLYFSKYWGSKPQYCFSVIVLVLGALTFAGGSIYIYATDNYAIDTVEVTKDVKNDNQEKIQAIMDVADSFILNGNTERALEELRFGIEKFSDAEELTAMYAAIQQSSYVVDPQKYSDGQSAQASGENQSAADQSSDSDNESGFLGKIWSKITGFFREFNDNPQILFYTFWGSLVFITLLVLFLILYDTRNDIANIDDTIGCLLIISFFVSGIMAISGLIKLGILSFSWKIPIMYISFFVVMLLLVFVIISAIADTTNNKISVKIGACAIAVWIGVFIGGSIYTFVTKGYVQESLTEKGDTEYTFMVESFATFGTDTSAQVVFPTKDDLV